MICSAWAAPWDAAGARAGGLLIVLVALLVSSVRADEITTREAQYRKVKVLDYEFGRIRFRQPAGDIMDLSILDVRTLLVDTVGNVTDLNQGELYLNKGEPAQAVLRYERALSATQGFWKELVRVRLLRACDQAGHLDKAVTHWLAILKGDPALAAELIPGSIPQTRTQVVNRALFDLEAAVTNDESSRRLVDLLRYAIYRRLGESTADELAGRIAESPLTGPLATVPAYAIKLDALRGVFHVKQTRQVLAGIDGALEDCPHVFLSDLLLLKGEVLLATAQGRADYIRAGWAFMRVPIHFPRTAQAARGLLGAARVYEKLGVPPKTVELLRECLAIPTCDAETRAAAAEALKRLNVK